MSKFYSSKLVIKFTLSGNVTHWYLIKRLRRDIECTRWHYWLMAWSKYAMLFAYVNKIMSSKSKDSQVDLLIHSLWFIKTSQPGVIFQRLLKENAAILKDSFISESRWVDKFIMLRPHWRQDYFTLYTSSFLINIKFLRLQFN